MTATIQHSERLPVTLVTGFLGSGKTTFINTALRAPELSRTVVVVNEFGEVGLDHSLFASSNDAVVVLENGCLCCTVRSDLVSTLNNLFHDRQAGRIRDFDNVVVETSGLAEPAPVIQAFLSEPTLDGLFRVVSVIALVDAVNWKKTAEAHDEAIRQVALADQILMTKLDLVEGDRATARSTLQAEIGRLNPAAVVQLVDWNTAAVARLLKPAGFDPADPGANPLPWLNLAAHQHRHAHAHGSGSHLDDKGVESFVLLRDNPVSRDELQFLLDGIAQNLGPSLLRVKGLVNVAEEPGRPAVIQGAQHLLHTMTWLDAWPDADQRTRVIFITQGIARDKLKDLVELLDRISERTFKARERGRLARMADRDRMGHE
jgi:G3E family GTPase